MDKVKELIIAHLELMKPEELILLYLLIRKIIIGKGFLLCRLIGV